jgi:hypothetical protein
MSTRVSFRAESLQDIRLRHCEERKLAMMSKWSRYGRHPIASFAARWNAGRAAQASR